MRLIKNELGLICHALPQRAGVALHFMKLKNILTDLLRDRSGATVVEYAFILGLVVIVMLVALRGVATATINMWNDVSAETSSAINGE